MFKKFLSVILFFVLFINCVPAFAGGPWKGRITDLETGEPLEGAVVVGVWLRAYRTPAGANTYFYEAKEVLTDGNGEFEIPVYTPINLLPLISYIRDPLFTIFKPGYLKVEVNQTFLVENSTEKGGGFEASREIKKYRVSGGKVELPQLKTKEERRKYLPVSGDPFIDHNDKKRNYMRLLDEERIYLGLEPILETGGGK